MANPVVKLALFSVLMMLVPLGVFFALRSPAAATALPFLAGYDQTTVSVAGAVIAVNILLVAYVVMAWFEDMESDAAALAQARKKK